MVQFSDIIAYFETLAINHVDIAHSATNKHFYRFELDEVLTSKESKLKFKALILEGYDFNFIDLQSDNLLKSRNGAFMIVDYCGDENKSDRINAIYEECEDIGDEIMVRILSDKRLKTVSVVKHFDIQQTMGNMIANPSRGIYGMRYTFSLIAPRTNDIDITKWTDK